MTLPTMAPIFDDFFVLPWLLARLVDVLVGIADIDGNNELEPVEVPDSETVDGTGASTSG